MEIIVPMYAVLTVSNKPVILSLDPVQRAVIQGFTMTSVTTPAVVVWRDVTETRGSVKGRVQSVHMVHAVK